MDLHSASSSDDVLFNTRYHFCFSASLALWATHGTKVFRPRDKYCDLHSHWQMLDGVLVLSCYIMLH